MRLIHTADIHLDASFAVAGAPAGFGNRRRQSLRDVFRSIVRRAGEWPADALLIAGDLFELDRVSRDTLSLLNVEFASIPHVRVFIAPGNHDPYVPHSPYAAEVWPENVVIFSNPAWTLYPLPNVPLTVHGFGFDGPDLTVNPFGQLQIPPDGRVHVAVAHGSERGHQPPDKAAYAPFDAPQAAPDGLAYLALGHFHSLTRIEGDFRTAIYYSGAPEGHSFGEPGPRQYLEVELESGQVSVKPVESSRAVYETHTLDCTDFSTAQQIVDAIRAWPKQNAAARIVRLALQGLCAPAIRAQLESVRDAIAAEFEYFELVDQTESTEDYALLARENTSFGAFLYRMNEAIGAVAEEDRRRLLWRAREIGAAAYRGTALPIRGLERGAP
ncbi:MAG: DNA repair exonuclease [Candidatus Hydrogenedentes bacterium]|nr:DNA repair exonuclease [Candidatus Hydrogenedentota bacterium]